MLHASELTLLWFFLGFCTTMQSFVLDALVCLNQVCVKFMYPLALILFFSGSYMHYYYEYAHDWASARQGCGQLRVRSAQRPNSMCLGTCFNYFF